MKQNEAGVEQTKPGIGQTEQSVKQAEQNQQTEHLQTLNKLLLRGWLLIVVVLIISYAVEVAKGTRTAEYVFQFAFIALLPLIIIALYYYFSPSSPALKYGFVACYLLMYAYALSTGTTPLVFCYIFPLLSLLILYHDKSLILLTSALAVACNVFFILSHAFRGEITLQNSRDYEIQLTVMLLSFAFCYISSKLYDDIQKQNEGFISEINQKSDQLEDMTMQTITAIANTIDAKDSYTEGHSLRVAEYSKAIALEMGKSEDEAEKVYYIALLHDIGKIGIPDSVLHKPGRLNDEEFNLIKQHPTIGARILKDVKAFPGLELGALYHHERYDGRGYPEGLKGKKIPEVARIVCVADTFDAMNTNRVYRKRFSKQYVLNELDRCSGTQFDPEVAAAMKRLAEQDIAQHVEERTSTEDRRKEPGGSAIDLMQLSQMLMTSLGEDHSDKYLLDSLADRETIARVENDIVTSLDAHDGCLLLIDLDDMSALNRDYGLLHGDLCLASMASVLADPKRNMPVCRLEGDEFLCFFSGVTDMPGVEAYIRDLIDNLRLSLLAEIQDKDPSSIPTFSVGAAASFTCGRQFSKLMFSAEKALNKVKQAGKNDYHIYNKSAVIDDTSLEEAALERDLDNLTSIIEHKESYSGALKLDYSEFEHVYELLRNIGSRNSQSVQLVLFTIQFNDSEDIHISDRASVMQYLEMAIANTVRKVDVTARYSTTQQLALFSNLSDENLMIVVERIIKEFYCMVSSTKFNLMYSCRNIDIVKKGDNAQIAEAEATAPQSAAEGSSAQAQA